jgi:hypothetical protein
MSIEPPETNPIGGALKTESTSNPGSTAPFGNFTVPNGATLNGSSGSLLSVPDFSLVIPLDPRKPVTTAPAAK